MSTSLKLLTTVGYLVFVSMNILGLYGSYTFAEALRIDLLAMEGAKTIANTHDVLQTHSFIRQRTVTFRIHLIVGLAILSVVRLSRLGDETGE